MFKRLIFAFEKLESATAKVLNLAKIQSHRKMIVFHHNEPDLPVLKLSKPVRRVSLEAYLRREERNEGRGERYEFFDGELIKVPMAKAPHNEVISNVITAIKNAIKKEKLHFRVFSGQQLIYSAVENAAFYPDVLVVSEAPIFWDDHENLMINPILIVEIASRSTRKYDREGKFEIYKTLESFREYLIIRPDQCRVKTSFREEVGLWRDTIQTDLNGSIQLRSLGVSISLLDIYEHVLSA